MKSLGTDDYRKFVANLLANEVIEVVWGDGGTERGVPREVTPNQKNLFGIIRLTKKILPKISKDDPGTVIFDLLVNSDEANGFVLNEFGLKAKNGDFWRIGTFNDVKKEEDLEISFTIQLKF
jgi:hypothetical protein